MEVGLFVPCYVDQFYPRVGLATAAVLERFGVTVRFPERQTCCGQPMANSGFFDDARPLARKMLEVFRECSVIVCPSGSCAAMVRHQYRDLFPGDERFIEMGTRTYELCEYLHDVLKVRVNGRFPFKVGLHHGCHGLRELRLGTGSERLLPHYDKVCAMLEPLEGIELVSLSRPDECCGFGGTFAVAEEAVSCAMGRDRIADHDRAGAQVVTSVDMSCLMHLEGLMRRAKKPLRVMHVAEILAEAAA